jgi:uncharacterized membrane protein
VKELTNVKKGLVAAAIALVIIGFGEFNTLFVLVTMNLPAYAQRLENTTKLNITSSMADAPSRPSEKQFLPDEDSITLTPGLSTDELNTNTQQDSADIGENDPQEKIPELQPEVLDQQRSEQNNDVVAKPTLDVETASENLDEKQDETTRNFATQNEDSEDSEQEDRQQTEEQRDESRTDENEAQGNSAVSEEQNEQGKEDGEAEDGDEDKDNGNKDDSDGDEDKDEDKDEGDDTNEIPFELPFP